MSQDASPLLEWKKLIRRALNQAAGSDWSAAVVTLRATLEKLMYGVARSTGVRASGSTEPLNNLIDLLSPKTLPADITASARFVKDLGNEGAHLKREIREDEFVNSLKKLLGVMHWYERQYDTNATALAQSANGGDAQSAREKDGPYKDITVVLIQQYAGSDIEEEWRQMDNALRSYGATVVSQAPPPTDETQKRNVLFVQLLSTLDCLDRAKSELKMCGFAASSDLIFQWRKPVLPLKIGEAIQRSLDEDDKRFCEGAQTGSFEEFKLRLWDKISEFSSKLNSGEPPILYITFDETNANERECVSKLVNLITERGGMLLPLPLRPRPPTHQQKDFINKLKEASGFVFLYGDTEPTSIQQWVDNYARGKRALKNLMRANLRLLAIFEAPPQKEQMKDSEPIIGLPKQEWRKYGSRAEEKLQAINDACSELARANT
jgi:hypothetical protein